MIRKTIAAAVAAALLGSVGMTLAAQGGGHGGGMGGGGTVNSNAPGTIDRDLGRARAAERMPVKSGLHTTTAARDRDLQRSSSGM